jgi:hypothetical protein
MMATEIDIINIVQPNSGADVASYVNIFRTQSVKCTFGRGRREARQLRDFSFDRIMYISSPLPAAILVSPMLTRLAFLMK